jgi:hypothetical protein
MVSRSSSPKSLASGSWGSVITPVARRGDRRTALLLVDQNHPFFFDHPLDHVSGMLLMTGLLDLVRASADPFLGTRSGRRVRLSLKFVKFCELDQRVLLIAEPDPANGGDKWAIRAVRGDCTVCEGTIELVRDTERLPRWPADGRPVAPCMPALVHRADSSNVVLGAPTICDGCYHVPLVSPPAGHFLRRHGEDRYGVEEMIESGRQLFTAATHIAHEQPAGTQLVWIVLNADLPAAPVRSVPLALDWVVRPPRGNTGVFEFTLVANGTSHRVGSLSYVMKSFTPAAYQQLRESQR